MTVHAAKGLEFPHVFVCSLEEGVFPSKKTSTLENMEEERRLAFVAITRAQKSLFLTDAEGRNLDGSYRYPSRFIFNIDKTLLTYTNELPGSLVSESGWNITNSEKMLEVMANGPSFTVGDRVVHTIMGAGEVIAYDSENASYIIKFDTIPTLRNISIRADIKHETAEE